MMNNRMNGQMNTTKNSARLFFFLSLLSLLGVLFASPMAWAIQTPRSLATDQRIKVVPFEDNNVVPVEATTFTATQVVSSKDEFIEDIQNGDLSAWTVDVQKQLPNMLFIKPTIVGSDTNLTVMTNHHTYYFHLMSNQVTDSEKTTYAIHFLYPKEEHDALLKKLDLKRQERKSILNATQTPQNYNWDYSFNGDTRILPLHVFDDGRNTYLQLRPGQPVPAIFAVDNASGNESVVNYRRDGEYLIIERKAPQFTLRNGADMVVSIFNDHAISNEVWS
jgi:type IV secretion system protein VirB9